VLCLAVVAVLWLPRLLIEGEQNTGLVGLLDAVVGVAIFLVALSTVAGVAYGLWNGGPLLAYAIPTLPLLLGSAVAGQFVLTVDAALALSGGAAAATAATTTTRRGAGSTDATLVGTALATAGTVVAGVALWRVAGAAGAYASTGVQAAAALLGIAVLGLVADLAVRVTA